MLTALYFINPLNKNVETFYTASNLHRNKQIYIDYIIQSIVGKDAPF